jgi:hypothetical protein
LSPSVALHPRQHDFAQSAEHSTDALSALDSPQELRVSAKANKTTLKIDIIFFILQILLVNNDANISK